MGRAARHRKAENIACYLAKLGVLSFRPMPMEARACSSSVETTG
jgi:hypothetical protein